jgi:hypothetical protein
MSDCYHETCWYCDDLLVDGHEHDHVQPRRAGGTVTVAACLDCHNLKDRVTLNNWPADAAMHALLAIAEYEMFDDARAAVTAILTGAPAVAMPLRGERDIVDTIGALPSGHPRILMAKMYALGLDASRLTPDSAAGVYARTA